jgi:hypothetical protein
VLAGGLAMGLLANHWVDEANDSLSRGDRDGYDANKSKAKNIAIGADVSYAVGGALVVTGVVLFFLEDELTEKPADRGHVIAPYVSRSGVGLAAGGTF